MTIDKRINFRFGGAYQGGSGAPGSAEAPGKKTSSGTGGSKGNIGGGGGGQESEYRRYEAPTRPTYDSTNIDQKPVTGADFRRSENEFVNNLNQNNFLRAQQTNTPFQPYQGGAFAIDRMKQSNPARGIMSLLASVAIPGAGFFLNQGSKLRDGLMGLNNQLQQSDFGKSTSLMDYLDMRKYGGYDEREMARRINMDEARLLQADIDSGLYDGTGGVRPLQTFEFDPSNFNRNIETGIVKELVPNNDPMFMQIGMNEAQKEKALQEMGYSVPPEKIMPKLQQLDETKFFMKTDDRIRAKEFIDFYEKNKGPLTDEQKMKIYMKAGEDFEEEA
jgi:hypothetical protein